MEDFFEVPAGYRDADIEMAEMYAEGARIAVLHRKGICTHGWVQGSPGNNLPTGQVKCLEDDCGAIFATEDEWLDARDEALSN